jgi:LmbE family N-acetylglucosaminyl deacetylase
MPVVEPPGAVSIMAVAAHPDDIEFGCTGTLMRAIAGGATARLLLVTSGDKGSGDPATDSRALAIRREAEARAAGEIIGLSDVAFLRHTDGEVENTTQLRREITFWIRAWRPEVIFTFDPDHALPRYISHRDHRTVGRATLDCVYPLARDPLAFPEQVLAGLQPYKVGQVWLFASDIADTYVDIAEVFERKIEARLAHVSQTRDAEALRKRFRERAETLSKPSGLPYAEAFTLINIGF